MSADHDSLSNTAARSTVFVRQKKSSAEGGPGNYGSNSGVWAKAPESDGAWSCPFAGGVEEDGAEAANEKRSQVLTWLLLGTRAPELC
ncbi:UNVERIFIED_CONTAM: hypothetical protein K2H54_059467 [Gekko kuhli]